MIAWVWSVAALAVPPELEVWTQGALELQLPQGPEVVVEQHLRFVPEEISLLRVWEVLTDLELRGDVAEPLRLGVGVRGGARNEWDTGFQARWRLHLDARWRARLGALRASIRERWQARLPRARQRPQPTLRSKVQLAMDVGGDVRLAVSMEPFHRLDQSWRFDRLRTEASIRVALPDDVQMELWGRRELHGRGRPSTILGVGFDKELEIGARP
ncbi:MAG: DUF2490 domain-containing protein [Myxococcales bacterium]|nr:DUF2490 domain-containing protein [Myxococcales bacterium]